MTDQTIPVSPPPGSPPAAPPPVDPGAGGNQPPTRPEGLPDRFWDDKAGVKLPDLVQTAAEFEKVRAADEARKATLPKDSAGYKVEVPSAADLAKKYGMEPAAIKIDEADPLIGEFKDFALQNGMSQEAFGKALGMFADAQLGSQIGATKKIQEAIAAEDKSLGDGPGRKAAVGTFLTAHIGEAGAKALTSNLFSAAQVQAFEALQKAMSSQGVKPAPAGGDAPLGKPALTDDQRTRMSPAERLAWARENQTKAA